MVLALGSLWVSDSAFSAGSLSAGFPDTLYTVSRFGCEGPVGLRSSEDMIVVVVVCMSVVVQLADSSSIARGIGDRCQLQVVSLVHFR